MFNICVTNILQVNINRYGRQCTYNVTMKCVRAAIVAVEQQSALHIVCVCRFSYPACNELAPYCHLWSAPLYHIFHIISKTVRFSKKNYGYKMCVL